MESAGEEVEFGGYAGLDVVLTPTGREAIDAAAPKHVATVRRLVIDAISPDELATLGQISNRILTQLDNVSS